MDNIITVKENNITFLFEELEHGNDNAINFSFDSLNEYNNSNNSLSYFIKKELYGNDELYYEEYKIKELMKICQYYGIAKNIKTSKCKKQDIISTIIYFENCPENYNIVEQRNTMWGYIGALLEDSKMKGYILW